MGRQNGGNGAERATTWRLLPLLPFSFFSFSFSVKNRDGLGGRSGLPFVAAAWSGMEMEGNI